MYSVVDGYSVYIKGLPMNATPALLEKEFKKFGPITPNGIQVRSNMGFCFRFVEFEVPDAVQKAIQVFFSVILGATPMAAFQICLQVWLTSSLLAHGLVVAEQVDVVCFVLWFKSQTIYQNRMVSRNL
ncbi:putative Ras GTPase-activating protein-binding protein [Helianthus anomalus]